MRPEVLNNLFQNMLSLEGVGEKTGNYLSSLTGSSFVSSLLWHLPASVIFRRKFLKIADTFDYATLKIKVASHEKSRNLYKVICHDDYDDELILTFFHGKADYLKTQLPINECRFVSGKIEIFKGIKQISHPSYISETIENIPEFEPVYPLTAGLGLKTLRGVIKQALKKIPSMPEWLDKELLKSQKWADFNTSINKAHSPKNIEDIQHFTKERRRLAYDELLSNQLALAILRKDTRHLKGNPLKIDDALQKKLRDALPFNLTNAQNRAITEINNDMASNNRMIRLLQGDVGSGKTMVALFACLNAFANYYQSAIMAPTDILARQHFKSISVLTEKIGISVVLLTGGLNAKEKQEALLKISSGDADIIIGTHAIFQNKVDFKNLGLVIIDEQHRFGVHQRLKLSEKGDKCDMLVMSATPIPRTLALTIYGDMDLSILDEKPLGRKDIITCALSAKKIDNVIEALSRAIKDEKQIYWVCPLVEETLKSDLKAATERYEFLSNIFKDKVGIIHGRMKNDEKEDAMQNFSSGKTKILVATTVIEVGIDVKKATVIIIEHAERFGLSQLHQLRGRVGRSDEESSCILLYGESLTLIAKQRINVLRSTNDGFKIAEEDLKIRGSGDVLGTKQSGLPDFKLANLNYDSDLLAISSRDANLIIKTDPFLQSERGKALRYLLYLFNQDSAIMNLKSG